MKKNSLLFLCLCLSAILTSGIMSCNKDDDDDKLVLDWQNNPDAVIYAPDADPFGKSLAEWGAETWVWAYSLDCVSIFESQVIDLSNDVSLYSAIVSDTTEHFVISRNKALFLPIVSIVNSYPCPDPDFEPAQGQSLEDFLQEGARALIDPIINLQFTFDGEALQNINDFRATSDLFYYTGNAELAACYDPCVNGQSQPGVSDGYFLMFKKLSPGQHIITMHGEIPSFQFTWDMELHVTVQ